jgi:uncharacterized protein YecT (DUF1311 family)
MKASNHWLLAGILLPALVISGRPAGQESTKPRKVLTPAQQEHQEKFRSYMAQRQALQRRAVQAFDAETARAKTDACKSDSTTRGIEICLEKEIGITEKNYSAFTGAIRELLSLDYPSSDPSATPGPTGTPLSAGTLANEFDALQNAWEQYRKLGTATAYDQYKGGSIAPVVSAEVNQELVLSHMRELNSIYEGLLHR